MVVVMTPEDLRDYILELKEDSQNRDDRERTEQTV